MIRTILLVGAGGFIGSVLRVLMSQAIYDKYTAAFPWGTLCVNVLGCFVIGLVFAYSEKGIISNDWRLFLATGICGGFTTFSAFSNETIALLRDGQTGYAFLYIAGSLILGLLATFGAITLFK